jgi:hypothetical protein
MIPSWQIPVLEDLATTYASCGIFDISTDQLSDFVAKQVQHEQRLPENRRLGYSRLQGAILVNPTRIAERVNNIIRHKLTENVIPGEYAEITEDCLIHSFRFTLADQLEEELLKAKVTKFVINTWNTAAKVISVRKINARIFEVKIATNILYPTMYDAFRELTWIS